MAKNVELMGAVFPDCPAVMLPTHEGPLARFTDVSDSQAVAADVAQGKAFYLADGTKATGTNQGGGGGGGGGTIKPNARLVLIDYDGSIVDSYTQSEIDALSALPENPDHSGDEIPLTSQGWNWTLAEVREQLAAMPEQTVYVGNVVIPTDGKTHILIYIDPETTSDKMSFSLRYQQTTSQGVYINWGDGSGQRYTGTSNTIRTHTYAAPGWYDITMNVTSGQLVIQGNSTYSIFGQVALTEGWQMKRIRRIHFGNGLSTNGVNSYSVWNCNRLEALTIPEGLLYIGGRAIRENCNLPAIVLPKSLLSVGIEFAYMDYNLKYVSLPPAVTEIGNYAFYNCHSMRGITLTPSIKTVGNYAFSDCKNLETITIPSKTTIGTNVCSNDTRLMSADMKKAAVNPGNNMFSSCTNLETATIPESATTIPTSMFNTCYGLKTITIPAGVTSILDNAFKSCYSLMEIHLKPTTPPTLASNGFSGVTGTFYVPYSADHSILAAYQAASNWSTYASRMVEEAE